MRMEIVKMRMFFVKMLINCENANKGRATKPGKKGRQEGRRAGQKQRPNPVLRLSLPQKLADIVSTMLKEYDVEEAVLRGEVERFVALLHKDNIV